MKKNNYACLLLLALIVSQVNAQYGAYVQLYPNDSKKIVIQVRFDQNYTDVDVMVNFYSSDNRILRREISFQITDKVNKYVIKDQYVSRIFDHNYSGVSYVAVDKITRESARGKSDEGKGKKINAPILTAPLDPGFINAIPSSNTREPGKTAGSKTVPKMDKVVKPQNPSKSEPGLINSFTDAPTVMGADNSTYYFFARSDAQKIYYTSGKLGSTYSSWNEVEGNGLGSGFPAAVVVSNVIYLAIKRPDNNIYLNQGTINGSFGGWNPMNLFSDTNPALAGVGTKIYFFAKKTDGHIFYNYAESGAGGVGWREVDGNIIAGSAPSAAAVGNHVFVAVKGIDNTIYCNQADGGGQFSSWSPMGFQTNVAPALTAVGDYIYFFAVSADGQIFYNRAKLGQSFEGWKIVEGNRTTNSAVSAGATGNHIFITMKGTDGKFYLNQADLGGPFNSFWSLMQ